MTEELITQLAQKGLLGLLLAVSLVAIFWLYRDNKKTLKNSNEIHRNERDEWRRQSREQFNKIVEVTDKNTSVISEMKGLLSSLNK